MVWVTLIILLGLILLGICFFSSPKIEGMSSHFHDSLIPDTRCWPHCNYLNQCKYDHQSTSPGMYNRSAHWYPGYDTHSWSFDHRPGMGFGIVPRNQWVRNNGTYYHIDNGSVCDRMRDFYSRR